MANDTNTKTHAAVLERMRDELLREANRLDTTPHMTGGYEREKAEAIQAGIEALRAAERYKTALLEWKCSSCGGRAEWTDCTQCNDIENGTAEHATSHVHDDDFIVKCPGCDGTGLEYTAREALEAQQR